MLDHDLTIASQQFLVGSSVGTVLGQAVSSADVILNPRSRDRKLRNAVHDLRVALRRLNVVAVALAGLLPDKSARKLKRRTRRLRQSAGKLRDIDVQCGVLVELSQKANGDSVGFDLLLTELKKRRLKLIRRLQRTLRRRKSRHLWAWIAKGVVSELDAHDCSATEFRSLASAAVNASLIKFRDAQIAAADGTDEQLHTLRISAKRLRYTIELFDSYGVNVTGCEMRDEAESWQDTLGHLQDLVVVMERSQRVAAKSKWTKAERLALLQVTHLATQEYFNRRHTLSLPSYVN